MKRFSLLSLLVVIAALGYCKEPKWLTSRSSETSYIGVGSCSMSQADGQSIAEENALNDLARQIAVQIETNSFLSTREIDYSVSEMFEQTTKSSAKNLLEGHQLVGTYIDKKTDTYYVCYELNKQVYLLNKSKKEKEIADKGYSYVREAQRALSNGDMFRALTYYEQGLAAVEPWLYLDLRGFYDGKSVNVPDALYMGYASAFDGLVISVEPNTLKAIAGQSCSEDIRLHLTREGKNVANMPLEASFIESSGTITRSCKTDKEGVAIFRLSGITGKAKLAIIRFFVAKSVTSGLSPSFKRLLNTQTWPETVCRVEVESGPKIAYINDDGCDLETLPKQIGALLGNNHFVITPDPDEAEIFVNLTNSVDYAGIVNGEISNLNESYVNLEIKFFDNSNQHLLYTYSIQQLRVLTPEKNSIEQTMAQCTREVMKRVQKELPRKLTFNN